MFSKIAARVSMWCGCVHVRISCPVVAQCVLPLGQSHAFANAVRVGDCMVLHDHACAWQCAWPFAGWAWALGINHLVQAYSDAGQDVSFDPS